MKILMVVGSNVAHQLIRTGTFYVDLSIMPSSGHQTMNGETAAERLPATGRGR